MKAMELYMIERIKRPSIWDKGNRQVVFCIHGVPTSSLLQRKVVPQLQIQGFRAIAVDLPGY